MLGIFDSGIGGLSILRAIQNLCLEKPTESHHALHCPQNIQYVADSAYAPYGEQDSAYIIKRSLIITRFLLQQGCKTIVVACNTATAHAIQVLRDTYPNIAFIGVEPGLKIAHRLGLAHRIAVLATPATLASEKFQRLYRTLWSEPSSLNNDKLAARHLAHPPLLQACPGLAQAIEEEGFDGIRVQCLVAQFCAPLRIAQVNAVVLGCTHYPFVAHHIRQALNPTLSSPEASAVHLGVHLIDTSLAVARRALQVYAEQSKASSPIGPQNKLPQLAVWSNGNLTWLNRHLPQWLAYPPNTPAQTFTE